MAEEEVVTGDIPLDAILQQCWSGADVQSRPPTQQQPYTWNEIRLFISSSFVDTQAERDALVKHVIPKLNRRLADRFINIVPVDLRWGVLAEESKDHRTIQKTCLNQIDRCRDSIHEHPWFLGLRTERYGWVQTELLNSEGYEHPDLFDWVKTLEEHSKHLSITSLECIHAASAAKFAPPSPTVFFFERCITNIEDIEKEMKWVFEFEYVPENQVLSEEVHLQYIKCKEAGLYKADRDNLNKYLKNADQVKYTTYPCRYVKGGALVTGMRGKKKFGVGYVEDLAMFKLEVEKQLMDAIEKNFSPVDVTSIPEHVKENIPYANSAKLKASSFVGRAELLEECYSFCVSQDDASQVMIIHGEPGCGKSAIMSALSVKCLEQMQDEKGAFVFVHAADAFPGSNNLETMLKRLHASLSQYCEEIDGSSLYMDAITAINLRREHVMMLEETAREYPDNLFIVLIDAVNQLHDSFLAWKMWWLPSDKAPSNLRFVISTLNKENGTFENACAVCPTAIRVNVKDMAYEDGQEMVSTMLARYKKKLTTTSNDAFLGNQMDMLLKKNLSPLYLTAATHTLRTFGIYEKMKEFIENLPETIPTLFQFLLESWRKVYGQQFVNDITCMIAISKDGLLENEINDIVLYIEETAKMDYQCSFGRFYESLQGFLAAGGGGYLRFFHDQVNKVVLSRPSCGAKLMHLKLAQFYLHIIKPQLMEQPSCEPPAYYNHCLREVVYHQLQAGEDVDFTDTLCNVYFIREQVKYHQEDVLSDDYLNALTETKDKEKNKALREWSRFARLYAPFIRKFPDLVYTMALNHHPLSPIVQGTKKYPKPESSGTYPLFWNNIPAAEDHVLVKYIAERCYVSVQSCKLGLVCIGMESGRVCIFEADNGMLNYDLMFNEDSSDDTVSCLYISERFRTLWVGCESWLLGLNVESGSMEWHLDIHCGDWADGTGELVFIGTNKEVIVLDEEKVDIVNRWPLKSCSSFSLNRSRCILYTGHKGEINLWDLTGNLIKNVKFGTHNVNSIDAHPVQNDIVAIVQASFIRQINISTGEELLSIPDTRDHVLYDDCGDRIVTLNKDEKSIQVYHSQSGHLLNTLKGHSDVIINMRLVPGLRNAPQVLTAGFDGSIVFSLPDRLDDEDDLQSCNEEIMWCGFLPDGDKFVTLSEVGTLQIRSTGNGKREKVIDVDGWDKLKGGAAIHPNGEYLLLYSGQQLFWFDTHNLDKITAFTDFCPELEKNDVKISPDGLRCLISSKGTAYIFDISNPSCIRQISSHMLNSNIIACDIHLDSDQVVYSSQSNVSVWSLNTGERSHSFPEDEDDVSLQCTMYVQFLYNPQRILYVDVIRNVRVMNMEGEEVIHFQSDLSYMYSQSLAVMMNEILVTAESDNTVCFHDVRSGNVVNRFINHRTEGFACLAAHSSKNILVGGNRNGLVYLMKEHPMNSSGQVL